MNSYPKSVLGDTLKIEFPTSIESLLEMGPKFLTQAFHASGVLDNRNSVLEILEKTEFFGGGMGRKLCLTVRYEKPNSHLHDTLFVKFPRDFGDPLRELFAPLMLPEVKFALLSRQDAFPIHVPTCYFADFHRETQSGILITDKIQFGENGIEPCFEKCLDHEISNPLPYYQVLTSSMAKLAASQKTGRLGANLEVTFPFDPHYLDPASRIPYSCEQLKDKISILIDFAKRVPQLFPDGLGALEFLSLFAKEAELLLDQELEIRTELNKAEDYVALSHWNMNLDNTWFWTDQSDDKQAGLLDWGSVAQMNVAQAFYGMVCAAETNFLNVNRQILFAQFISEYKNNGGPHLELDHLSRYYFLSVGVLGIAWILDAPTLIENEVPDIDTVTGRDDPKLRDNFLARAQLQLLIVFLNEWREGAMSSRLS